MERSRPTQDRGQTAADGGRTTDGSEPRHLPAPLLRAPAAVLCHLLAVLFLLAGGCESEEQNAMADAYYLSPNRDLHKIGRVALLEMDSVSPYPQIAADITSALFLEIQKQQVFGVMAVPRDYPAWRSLQENLDSLQALRQLQAAREALNCNALLLGTVTRSEPYPHMVIGLRLKLIDLTDGQLLWALEQVWDSSDQSIQKRIKEYLQSQRQAGQASLREELAVVSPIMFSKFVAYEVARTFVARRRR